MLVGIGGIIVVIILVVIIIRILKPTGDGTKTPPHLRGPPPPLGEDVPSLDLTQPLVVEELPEMATADAMVSTEKVVEQNEIEAESEPKTVASWQELPNGNYLDPDANGMVWYRDVDGNSWYQNSDESWSMWQ